MEVGVQAGREDTCLTFDSAHVLTVKRGPQLLTRAALHNSHRMFSHSTHEEPEACRRKWPPRDACLGRKSQEGPRSNSSAARDDFQMWGVGAEED